ncbi:ComF family protein [Candidatus Dependentiae bacterium]|nr:ComF family protein [Candidatus Dependentiae bacterium]
MNKVLEKCISFVKKVVAPTFCFYCRDYGDDMCCPDCRNLIRPILSTEILIDEHYSVVVHAASAYEYPLKALVRAQQWSDYTATVSLGRLIWDHSILRHISFDYLVPLPDLTRSLATGSSYNPSLVIATEISRLSGKPVSSCLQRAKKSSTTTRLSDSKNQAFTYVKGEVDLQGKILVIIDDLMITGSTIHTAGNTLREARPKKIVSLVGCRVL